MKQETVAKQSTKNIVNFILGFGIGAISNIFLLPHLFKDQPEYLGAIQVTIAYIFITSDLVTLGSTLTIVRHFKDILLKYKKIDPLVWFSAILILIGYSIFLIVCFSFPELLNKISGDNQLVVSNFKYAIVVGIFFVAINKVLGAFLNGTGNTNKLSFSDEVLFKMSIIIWSSYYVFTSKDVIQSSSILLIFLVIMCYLIVETRRSVSKFQVNGVDNNGVDWKEMVKFSLFSGMKKLTTTLQQRLDVIIISAVLGNVEVAIFNIGAYLATVALIPLRSIAPMATTVVAQSWVTNDIQRIQRIYAQSARNQLLLAGPILMVLFGSIPLFNLILPESFKGFEYTLIILGMAKLVTSAFGINSAIIGTSHTYQIGFIIHVVLVALLALGMLWLTPIFGIEGAALASLLAMTIFNVINTVYLKFQYNLSFVSKTYFTAVIFIVIGLFITASTSIFFNSIFLSIPVTAITVCSIAWIGFKQEWSKDLNDQAQEMKKKFLSHS